MIIPKPWVKFHTCKKPDPEGALLETLQGEQAFIWLGGCGPYSLLERGSLALHSRLNAVKLNLRRQTRRAAGLLSLRLDGARVAASPNITPVRGLPSFPSLLGQEVIDGHSRG